MIHSDRGSEARSSVVEHCFDVAGVSGSIPLVPTNLSPLPSAEFTLSDSVKNRTEGVGTASLRYNDRMGR